MAGRGVSYALLLSGVIVSAVGCQEKSPSGEVVERKGETEATGGIDEPADLPGDSTTIPYRTPEGGPARFAFRSGIVDMEYVGIMNGVRRLRFDNYGLRERTFDSTYAAAERVPLMPTYSLILMTPESYSILDLRKEEGHFGPNESLAQYERTWREGDRPLGELVLDQTGAERLPDTLLLGTYPCRVYRQKSTGLTRTIYTHGGVPIGEAVTFGDNPNSGYRVLPREVRFDVELPDSLFTVPQGFSMTPFKPGSPNN